MSQLNFKKSNGTDVLVEALALFLGTWERNSKKISGSTNVVNRVETPEVSHLVFHSRFQATVPLDELPMSPCLQPHESCLSFPLGPAHIRQLDLCGKAASKRFCTPPFISDHHCRVEEREKTQGFLSRNQ